ncbi:MAG: sigma-70 family RNA polymerase sigma factor [Phycisphaeraceae bacterium]
MTHQDDQGHLNAIRSGDRTRLTPLLRAHQRRLYTLCLRVLGHHEDAADAAQDAVIQIIENIDRFEGRSQLSTWMSRIAINRALTLLRKRKSRPTLQLTGPGDSDRPDLALADSREPDPTLRVEQEEQTRQLANALNALEERFRVVLVLRDIEGMNYDEIATTTGLAIGTVKSRIFRARLALRQALDDAEARSGQREGAHG